MNNIIVKVLKLFSKSIKNHTNQNKITKNKTIATNILNNMLESVLLYEDTLASNLLEISKGFEINSILCKNKNKYPEDCYELVFKSTNKYIINEVHRNDHYFRYKSNNLYNACIVLSLLSIKTKIPNITKEEKEKNPNITIKELYKQKYIQEFERIMPILLGKEHNIEKKELENIKNIFLGI
ncbi:MAG: hypothetical protein HFJ45_07225 [Clostridia bacterium]|nr:hypothetical protein [Clostridia bacterium]